MAIAKSAVKCMLPQVISLIKFHLMCPASSATAERSFSQLRRLKTYPRSPMSQKRLNSLLILSTYTDEVDALDMRMLVNSFISRTDYQRKLFSNLRLIGLLFSHTLWRSTTLAVQLTKPQIHL